MLAMTFTANHNTLATNTSGGYSLSILVCSSARKSIFAPPLDSSLKKAVY
jgi:hypothetical protein